jgi:hypothetical protein
MDSHRPTIGLLVLLALAGTVSLWLTARSSAGIDFYQMWLGGRASANTPDFYSPAARERLGREYLERARTEEPSPRRLAVAQYRQQLETLSTPMLYMAFSAFRGTYEFDLFVFQVLVFASLICWVGIMTRLYRYPLMAALALYGFLTLVFEPVRSDIRVVNMNHMILLLISGAMVFTFRRNYAAAGALLALAALLKPYTILVFPLTYACWLVRGRWRDTGVHLAGAAAACIAAIFASSVHFRSSRIWLEWLSDFRAMPAAMVPLELGNFAFARLIKELSGFDIAVAVLLILGGATVAIARTSSSSVHTDLLVIGLGCVLFQFASPLVWVHHLLLSVPLIAYLLRPPGETESPAHARQRQLAALIAFAFTSVGPWSTVFPEVVQVAAIANVGLLVAYAAGLRDLYAPPGLERAA